MQFRKLSLSNRLWIVLSVAILPLFVLTLYDYRKERTASLFAIEHEARLMLNSALIAEAEVLHQVEMTLRIMSGADDLANLNPAACNALAKRLKVAQSDIANIGAVYPNGDVFCSATDFTKQINVTDRAWFREALTSKGVTAGQFLVGRITGETGAVFGYPLRGNDGELRALLFASSSTSWFDRFTQITNLPEGWVSLLVTREGQALSRYPEPEKWRGKVLSAESQSLLKAALSEGRQRVVMPGLDGVERLFVLIPLKLAQGQLIVSVGAPTHATLAAVERTFQGRLALLVGLALFSLLLAHYLLCELVDRRFSQTLDELHRLHTALDNVPAHVYMKDKAHRYVYANKTTLALFGVTPEALKGSDDERFFPPATAEHLKAVDLQVFAGHDTDEIIDVVDERQGRRVYHEIKTAIYEGPEQSLWGLCGISTDITAYHLAQEANRKLSLAIEQSPESIVFADLDGRIEYVNQAFQRVTGYSMEEVLGQNPRLLKSGKTPPERYEAMWSALSKGESWRGEFCNKRKDGSEYLELATISPIRQVDGKITHYLAMKADITELRRNENELHEYRAGLERLVQERTAELALAKEAAEAANQAKSTFLANMSHEIRTPMNAIIGFSYLLLNGELKPEQAEKVQKVSDAAKHLLQIINDILDLSKIEAGKLQLEDSSFSPADVVHAVADMIRERAASQGLQLNVVTGTLPERLFGDAMRLRQILLNFAGNALKFTEQGSITIAGEVVAEDGDTLQCRFSVRDTGIGIDADQLSRLFNNFEQLDNSTTRRYGGTGLGLAIAQHLSHLMGGEIGVESRPGVGSHFWVTARLRRAEPEARPMLEKENPATPLIGHVLFAEDEPVNREIGCDVLQSFGLSVVAVENGLAAVDRVKSDNFDLILMDLQMPLLDGLSATTQIRTLPGGAVVPIIALTANVLPEDRQLCLLAGMNDFLAKPVNPEALYALLARYLPAHKVIRPNKLSADLVVETPVQTSEAQLTTELAEIRALLASGNSEAELRFGQIRQALRQTFPAEINRLERVIALYDFEAAGLLVDKLLSELDAKTG